MRKDINQILADRVRIPSFHLYQLNFIRPFIDDYLEHPEKVKYKLFHKYIFRPDLFIDHLLNRGVSSKEMFKKDGSFNTDNQIVKYEIEQRMEIFIGYRKIKRTKCPFFLAVRPYNYNYETRKFNEIVISGFSTQIKDDWSNYYDEYIDAGEMNNYKVTILEDDLNRKDSIIRKLMEFTKKLKK